MSDRESPKVGTVAWRDLTVGDADQVRDFYHEVVGWRVDPVQMDGYNDYSMMASGSDAPVAGICHARGENAVLPSQWLIYIVVHDVDHSIERCIELGGKVIAGPRPLGEGRFCVISDPAGAVCALYESAF